jgi:tol-pal system protein YbgF
MINTVLKTLPLALAGLLVVNTTLADTSSSLDASPGASQKPVTVKVSSSSDRSALSSSAGQLLFSDIEVLKLEVQKLQGVIERQGYELNKLKVEQKERYLDLDRRITQAASQASVEIPTKTNSKGDGQYTAAYELMKARKFEAAAKGFQQFLQEYPKSPLVVNGYYWLGQIYYNQGKLNDARKAFTIVVNQFPNHQKTADSMYKLGVVLHRLGDLSKGKEYLRQVVKQFSDSASSRFAKKYLQENYSK